MAGIGPDELRDLDAVAQAELVRRREVTPLELVDAAIERIERVNPKLNAVVTPMFELARETARGTLPDGPLRGVPFLLKDLMGTFAGVRETSGSRLLADNVPDHDSELVARFKRAGLVVVGKTNTPEFGIPPTTEPHLFGPARNPWNPGHSTGGSSGGSAAAVASGMVPAAHANDGGGSIRIPAACCGLFGLKPTRGRNPLGPDFGDVGGGLVAEHVVTRTVRDSAVLLDATAGPDVGDPYWAPLQVRPYREEVGADPGRLRIGYTVTSPMGAVHPDCVRAVEDAAALCQRLGHDVEERTPDIDVAHVQESFFKVFSSGAAMHVEAALQALGREPRDGELEPLTRAVFEIGRGITAPQYLIAVREVQAFSRRIAHALIDFDVWITPTLCEPPLALGVLDAPPDNPFAALLRAATYVPFTPLCNMSGQPAMSMPLHWNDDGLPIGTHFIGRFGDEATLFRLAAQLEAARPWATRRPPVCA
jgi:amidase